MTPPLTSTQPPPLTSTQTQSPTTTGPSSGSSPSTEAIAGGVIGGLVGVVLIVLIVIIIAYLVWRTKNSPSKCDYSVRGMFSMYDKWKAGSHLKLNQDTWLEFPVLFHWAMITDSICAAQLVLNASVALISMCCQNSVKISTGNFSIRKELCSFTLNILCAVHVYGELWGLVVVWWL